MRELRETDRKLLEQICQITQHSLMRTLYLYLKNEYETTVCTRDYLYAKGDIPVALVAHMDTVFSTPPEEIFYDTRKGVMWSPQGMGADDRAGVFLILKLLRSTKLRPSIIFTTDEEVGGVGASSIVKFVKEPFDNFKYLIQLDRQGTNDCVFYDCDNKKFIEYVESFGFTEAIGSFSDISTICPAWGVAGVNLSVGYKDEHTYIERLYVNALLSTYDKMVKMLEDVDNVEKFDWVPSPYYAYYYGKSYKDLYSRAGYYDYGCDWGYGFDGLDEKEEISSTEKDIEEYPVHCCKCDKVFADYEVFPVISRDGENIKYYCPDCMSDNIKNLQWCEECGDAFELDPKAPLEKNCKWCIDLKAKREKNKWNKAKAITVNSKKSATSKTSSVKLSENPKA